MKKNKMFKRPAAVFAAMALCFSLSVSAMAASGMLNGFFKDVKNPGGAVVGTTYEQATDEISIKLNVESDTLKVAASFTDVVPFEADEMAIGEYRIVNGDGKVVKEGTSTGYAKISDNQAVIKIYLDGVEDGSYKLIISSFIAGKKADQPLTVNGDWACNFTK